MVDVINLRTARKARARAEKDAAATANRRLFGQTGPEKRAAREEKDRLNRTLDGARRETD